jgi:hypothetical protein
MRSPRSAITGMPETIVATSSTRAPIVERIDSIVSTGTPRSSTKRPQMMIEPNRIADAAADSPPSGSLRAWGPLTLRRARSACA